MISTLLLTASVPVLADNLGYERADKTTVIAPMKVSPDTSTACCRAAHRPATSVNDKSAALFEFDIPRATRVEALHELSRQGMLLVAYLSSSDAEEQALVGPVQGRFTIEGALRIILADAMLAHRWGDKRDEPMVSVEPKLPGDGPGAADVPQRLTMPRIREAKPRPPEEIIVVAAPIRDVTGGAAPTVTISRKQLRASGVQTLPEALRYLSQSTSLRSAEHLSRGNQHAQWRVPGVDALVLINGRRAFPSAASPEVSAFDLGNVPMAAIDRVEVLFDSAASAYGTDAIGGVLNVVLREDIRYPSVELSYGSAAGGAREPRVTVSAGARSEFANAVFILDYLEQGDLIGIERDLWRDQNYTAFGGKDYRSITSHPGNITSATGGLLPGLSSSVASVPLLDPSAAVTVDDFAATAGSLQRESLYKYSSILPQMNRLSAVGQAEITLGTQLDLSAEMLLAKRDSIYEFSPPVIGGVLVPPTNAYNVFDSPVLAHRLLTYYEPQSERVESELRRGTIALRGSLHSWRWEVAGTYSWDDADFSLNGLLDSSALGGALASSDPNEALNLFQTGPVASQALSHRLLRREGSSLTFEGAQLTGFVEGPLWKLPAGAISVALGAEGREERIRYEKASDFTRASREVAAVYLQSRIPIISESMEMPAVNDLALTAGTRLDDYGSDRALCSQLGLTWKIHPSLTLRTSWGQTFEAPALTDLYAPPIGTIARVSDPARGHEVATVYVTTDGNPQLHSSTGETFTAGLLFKPVSAMNWEVSADYWRLALDDRVLAIPLRWILENESEFAGAVTRGEPQLIDIHAGMPGALESIETPRLNAGRMEVAGVDVAVRADVLTNAGRFTPALTVTWFDRFHAELPGTVATDWVGVASELGSVPPWRAVLSGQWRRGPFGVAAFVRHTPTYDDAFGGVRTGRELASRTLFDMQASIAIANGVKRRSAWRDLEIAAGVIDLFDEGTSFAEVGGVTGADLTQSDMKERSWYLRVEKRF